jgi:hypothetical protein
MSASADGIPIDQIRSDSVALSHLSNEARRRVSSSALVLSIYAVTDETGVGAQGLDTWVEAENVSSRRESTAPLGENGRGTD